MSNAFKVKRKSNQKIKEENYTQSRNSINVRHKSESVSQTAYLRIHSNMNTIIIIPPTNKTNKKKYENKGKSFVETKEEKQEKIE